MNGAYHYRALTWPEVNAAVLQRRVVLLPVGAIEQHAHHLPIDTDNLAVETICERAAEQAADGAGRLVIDVRGAELDYTPVRVTIRAIGGVAND